MDVDADRLQMIHRLAERYADELGADITFDQTLDRRAALQDSDFVINTASVVTYQSGLETRELIQKFGHDWDGPGSLEYSFYNSAFILEVAREIEEICPERSATRLLPILPREAEYARQSSFWGQGKANSGNSADILSRVAALLRPR